MGDEDQDLATSPSGADTQPDDTPASEKLASIEAQIGSQPQATAEEQPSQASSQGDAPLSGDVRVDWGDGAIRATTIEELVAAAKRAEEVQQMSSAVEAKLAEMGQLRQLGDIINGLDQTQITELQKLIANPAQLTAMAHGQRQPSRSRDSSDEAEVDDFLQTPSSKAPGPDPEMAELKNTVKALSNYVQADLAQKESVSLAQKVVNEMASFAVFKEVKGADTMARKSILNEIAATPNANLRSIVADHATKLHKLFLGAREGVVHERTGESPSRPLTLKKGWKPTADGLLDKSILRAAEEALNSGQI
jgi:hypothetical protein